MRGGTSTSSTDGPSHPTVREAATATIRITPHQALFSAWAVCLLADVVVLNLLVEFVPSIVIDSFYISILTAVFLRLLLGVTLQLEHRVAGYVRARDSKTLLILGGLVMWLILFSSKFVILELVDIVFGDHVDLGGFFEVVAIALALTAVELAMQRVFAWLGHH
jgi:hypothetical protein